MQKFKDSATGHLYELDDDVVADNSTGHYLFTGPGGALTGIPLTLIPADADDVPVPISMVPAAVSRYQGRQALRLSTIENGQVVINDASAPIEGKRDLLAAVEELLARATTPAYYREAWNDIQQFERDSPMLMAIADELGLSAANLDDLFIFAATLRA